ncbi:hypothetical protein AOQ84DRAFT_404160 [Glonium stellatum]|uniref:F-box domain-containing protein n=1 Tax=Glonium stellatum TaxID=574774 RepID=A0A8E2EMK9_9PEZI|nr:hypothetical protein AOQ84DRAFT_404160 [Glonium stellatum]
MAFNILPIELNKEIVGHLERDHDICAFRLVCRNTNYAVDGDGMSFWRYRFRQYYALGSAAISNTRLKRAYQKRRRWLNKGTGVEFKNGQTDHEIKTMEVLRDLINESFSGEIYDDKFGRPTCRNLFALEHFVRSSKNFTDVNRLGPRGASLSPQLAVLQLMCAHFMLDENVVKEDVYSFDVSQKAVYESAKVAPIFHGFNDLQVNMEWALHVLNFFRYHMMRESENTLYAPFHDLSDLQKPLAWKKKLRDSSHTLGGDWMGTYAYLDRQEIQRIRANPPGLEIFMDKNVDSGRAIQCLRLEFVDNEITWPALFERHLRSKPRPQHAKTRAQHKSGSPAIGEPVSFRFEGTGFDEEKFFASGWLNPLPPQQGIPGWQRMTMMKHFHDENGVTDSDYLWAYEGVVLPGGQMILGRWWGVDEDASAHEIYSGPFIFWNVEDCQGMYEETDTEEYE